MSTDTIDVQTATDAKPDDNPEFHGTGKRLDVVLRQVLAEVPVEFHPTVVTQLTEYAMTRTDEERAKVEADVIHYTLVLARKHGWCDTAIHILARIFPEHTGEWRDLNGFDRYGYTVDGFNEEGYHRDTDLTKDGYDRRGLHHETRLDRDGFDRRGIHHETGLTKDGYNRDGFHHETGYNAAGYNKAGFHKDTGRDSKGYDVNGLDEEGRSKFRFDENGIDPEGYNRDGFDAEGYDREGFHYRTGRDKEGFDRNGKDRYGFDKATGKNKFGQDRFSFGADRFDAEGYSWEGTCRDGYTREMHEEQGTKPRLYS